jgi:glycine dehydrogenase subunit 1
MAARITGRSHVLVPDTISPERLAVIRTYCGAAEPSRRIEVELVAHDAATGGIDLNDLEAKLSERTAAVLFDNPSYLGVIEANAAEIAALARSRGAETVVGVDPLSLGVLAPPSDYGADIVVGTTQPLGVHMSCGGGAGGFIASRDDARYAHEYPTLLLSIAETVAGEHGFGIALFEQTSYGSREDGNDWTGNSVYLWAVANAAYMSLMGPEGFAEVGRLILARSHYAARRLGEIDGVRVVFPRGFFKELVVDFAGCGKSVAAVNRGLRSHGIFGGIDLSRAFPSLGQAALYCVTEIHTEADIDRLAAAVAEVVA